MADRRIQWDVSKKLTERECKSNARRFRAHFRECACSEKANDPELKASCSMLPLTHVFGDALLKKIFFTSIPPGLHSIEKRNPGSAPDRPHVAKVVKIGLHKYVFAYCGIHDPEYAGTLSPIGVFLSQGCGADTVQDTNVSYRDFYSREEWISGEVISRMDHNCMKELFFSKVGVEELIALDVSCSESEDVWDYWGNPMDSRFKPTFGATFGKKFEFHYLNHVPADQLCAMLAPKYTIYNDEGEELDVPGLDDELYIMSQLFPGVKILRYEFDRDPIPSFLEASYVVGKYLANNKGVPPANLHVARKAVR